MRRFGIGVAVIGLVLVLVGLGWPRSVPEAPRPAESVVLHRPAPDGIRGARRPAPAEHPRSAPSPVARPTAPPEPPVDTEVAADDALLDPPPEAPPGDLTDLSPEELQDLLDDASERIAELGEACGHLASPDGSQIMAGVTLDERGLLALELSSYDDDELGMWETEDPLPPQLVTCLDEVLWDQDWPTRDAGLRFALSLDW
ncbi:MAG: hypothetical protein ACI9K2_001998 [Myxococcota bacterium]|jgi:hypothetical protein